MDKVILVDIDDNPVGTEEKLKAHEMALLHRAFSVFVFNSEGELMLQQRAMHKYHSPGLWTNTCCSHPRPEENTLDAAHRRLKEEMGFDCDLEWKFSFVYKASFDNGLTEHEFDHVFFGSFSGEPKINPDEVHAWKWIAMKDLIELMKANPAEYTVWFRIAMDKIIEQQLVN